MSSQNYTGYEQSAYYTNQPSRYGSITGTAYSQRQEFHFYCTAEPDISQMGALSGWVLNPTCYPSQAPELYAGWTEAQLDDFISKLPSAMSDPSVLIHLYTYRNLNYEMVRRMAKNITVNSITKHLHDYGLTGRGAKATWVEPYEFEDYTGKKLPGRSSDTLHSA